VNAATIVTLAQSSADKVDFERGLLDDLMSHVGADVGAFRAGAKGAPTSRGFSTSVVVMKGGDPWARHAPEIRPVLAVARQMGSAVDADVLGESRVRSTRYFDEIVRPHGGRETLCAVPTWRGEPAGCLLLGRCGPRGRFRPADLGRVNGLLPAIAVASLAFAIADRPRAGAALSSRESEIVDLLSLGFRSREIALALGTSVNTVRNQVSRLMTRLGATTRAELIAFLQRGHP